jgi:translation initiation factor IF-2
MILLTASLTSSVLAASISLAVGCAGTGGASGRAASVAAARVAGHGVARERARGPEARRRRAARLPTAAAAGPGWPPIRPGCRQGVAAARGRARGPGLQQGFRPRPRAPLHERPTAGASRRPLGRRATAAGPAARLPAQPAIWWGRCVPRRTSFMSFRAPDAPRRGGWPRPGPGAGGGSACVAGEGSLPWLRGCERRVWGGGDGGPVKRGRGGAGGRAGRRGAAPSAVASRRDAPPGAGRGRGGGQGQPPVMLAAPRRRRTPACAQVPGARAAPSPCSGGDWEEGGAGRVGGGRGARPREQKGAQ